MRSAAAFVAERQPELFAPPPIRPGDYIRLRREAAGLTIEQAARLFVHREEHRATIEDNLRFFESPGVTIKHVRWLDLGRAFPFDAGVYEQLRDLPPEHHPRLCRACGWDAWSPQLDAHDLEVTWSADDATICTGCAQRAGGGR